jgi:hypothetical protein
MAPSDHFEAPTSIHDRGVRETDDMAQKMAFDTVLTRWYIHLMVKHGKALITSILTKMMKPVMYVLCWQLMGSILME